MPQRRCSTLFQSVVRPKYCKNKGTGAGPSIDDAKMIIFLSDQQLKGVSIPAVIHGYKSGSSLIKISQLLANLNTCRRFSCLAAYNGLPLRGCFKSALLHQNPEFPGSENLPSLKMKSARIVYLVDDDEDDRMLIREALEQVIDNVKIIEATDGRNLLNLLASRGEDTEPTLILLDINMPRMNGLETLGRLRSAPGTEHIPVLILSTSSDQYYVKNAYNLGVNAYLKKPTSISDYTYLAESVNVCFLNSYPTLLDGLELTKSLHTRSILVVEDDADHWALMHLALKQSMPKASVYRMRDSESTLQFLENEWNTLPLRPQLIVLDLYLPSRDKGLDLLEKIRAFLVDNNLSTLPIIIFSSSSHQDDIKACYQRLANAYMVKPFSMKDSVAYFKTLNQFIWDNYMNAPKLRT